MSPPSVLATTGTMTQAGEWCYSLSSSAVAVGFEHANSLVFSDTFVDPFEVGEHSEHPPMTVVAFRDGQLGQDGTDMRFDSAFADDEPVCDADVGHSLSHKLDHPALSFRQPRQRRIALSSRCPELGEVRYRIQA
jgi:hypothetical protein